MFSHRDLARLNDLEMQVYQFIIKHCEGVSIKKLLADPRGPWDRPAITTHGYQNHAARSEAFNCLRNSLPVD